MFKYSKVNGEEEAEALLRGDEFMVDLVNKIGIFAYSFLILFLFGRKPKNCQLIQEYASKNQREQIDYLFYIRDHIGGSIRPFSEKLSRFETNIVCNKNILVQKIQCLLEKVENDGICLTNDGIKEFFKSKKSEIINSFNEGNSLKIEYPGSKNITNDDLPLLAKVHTLNLSNSLELTDVSALGNVKHLDLTGCVNVNTGFSRLYNATKLSLSRTRVTDKDIQHFEKVEELSLTGCKGITNISKILVLPNLRELWIGGTEIKLNQFENMSEYYGHDGEYIFNTTNMEGNPVKIYFTY